MRRRANVYKWLGKDGKFFLDGFFGFDDAVKTPVPGQAFGNQESTVYSRFFALHTRRRSKRMSRIKAEERTRSANLLRRLI